MEPLNMSKRERDRLAIMAGVKRKELALVPASEGWALSYRQAGGVAPVRRVGASGRAAFCSRRTVGLDKLGP